MANAPTTLTEVDPRMVPCPNQLTAAPCPLHGGPVPELEAGPIGASIGDTDPVPAPEDQPAGAIRFFFGRCRVCDGGMQVSPEGLPIRVLPAQ